MSPVLRPFALILLAAVPACGEVKDVPDDADPGVDAGPADAPVVADAAVDSGSEPPPPPPRCDVSKPFGQPVKLRGLVNVDGFDDHAAWLTDDERRMYFSSNRIGNSYLTFLAVRAEPDDDFGEPMRVDDLDGANNNPTLSPDQLTVYFDARRGNDPTYFDVYRATRRAITDPFSDVTVIGGVTGPGESLDGAPEISRDGATLYMMRRPTPTDTFAIHVATQVGGQFTIAAGAAPLISDGQHPVISADGRNLYFNRADQKIYTAARSLDSGPFGAAVELPTWVSPDGCRLYMHSSRVLDAKNDLYVASRPPLP
jgi:Tol biopolymer transport system component